MNDRRFVLIAPGRSGSTMLRVMLNGLPDTICHGEVYGTRVVHGAVSDLEKHTLLTLRQHDQSEFLRQLGFVPGARVGMKLLYSQFFGDWTVNYLRYLVENPQIRVVHLWRRDMAARYFSNLLHSARAHNRRLREPKVIDHVCDGADIYIDAKKQVSFSHVVRHLLRDHEQHNVAYEDILNDESARRELLEFLDLKNELKRFNVPEAIVSPKTSLVSLNLIGRDEAIADFDERLAVSPLRTLA